MKKLFIICSLFAALSAHATISNIVTEVEAENHIQHMREKGFTLSNIKDNYATEGRRPRCICDSYTFTYSKFVVENNVASMKEKHFSVNSNGFGAAKKIRVNEVR